MKLIKISMELIIDDDDICEMENNTNIKDTIAAYLNNKLYQDPEFFGDFGPENIETIGEFV
jgi:hypothetical protein